MPIDYTYVYVAEVDVYVRFVKIQIYTSGRLSDDHPPPL